MTALQEFIDQAAAKAIPQPGKEPREARVMTPLSRLQEFPRRLDQEMKRELQTLGNGFNPDSKRESEGALRAYEKALRIFQELFPRTRR